MFLRKSLGEVSGRTDKDLAEILALKEQQVQALDKDNFYYKQANRELKRRLRDLLTTSDADQLVWDSLSIMLPRKGLGRILNQTSWRYRQIYGIFVFKASDEMLDPGIMFCSYCIHRYCVVPYAAD